MASKNKSQPSAVASTVVDTRLEVAQDGQIIHAKLTSSDGLNRLHPGVLHEIERFAQARRYDYDTRVVVLSSDSKNFCLGHDLDPRHFDSTSDKTLLQRRRETDLGHHMIRAVRDIPAVTIAAIRGVAAGGGACLATACDFRVASDTARMGYPEVKMGFNLMWGSLPLCVQLVGPARAKRMIMKGALEPAPLLENWGLIDQVVPDDALYDVTLGMAQDYATLPPVSVQMIKRSINAVCDAVDRSVMHMDTDQFLVAMESEDSKAARASFQDSRQKKPPQR